MTRSILPRAVRGIRMCAAALIVTAAIPDAAVAQSWVRSLLNCAAPKSGSFWCLRDAPIVVPLRAESRSDVTKFTVGMIDSYQYAEGEGPRAGVDVSVGKEIPLFGWGDDRTRVATPGRTVVGVWVPVSFHMLWDLRGEASTPIVNTDYSFTPMLVKARHGLTDRLEVHGRLRPIAHESSHLGDELTLSAARRFGSDFDRVNVSQWYSELAVGGSYVLPAEKDAIVTVRGGAHRNHGYYYDAELLTGGTVTRSRRRTEAYLQAEGNYGWFSLSAEARNRIVYDYRPVVASRPEVTRLSWNVVAALADPNRSSGQNTKVDLIVRYYRGVNPHGQLRSQRDYQIFGAGLNVGF